MKTLRLFAFSLFLAAVFSVSAFAQTGAPTGMTKIVYINTSAFDDKTGITKYVNGMNVLETEFKPVNTELQTLGTRLQNLSKEIQTLQAQIQEGKVPVDRNAANAKVEEAEKLQRDYKFKEEDAKARYGRSYQRVMGPIMQDIGKALQDYAKQKGYAMILDAAKLEEAGIILAVGDANADVTKDFITFYNARPATTATTAAPR